MNLSSKQKNYIRKNLKRFNEKQLAQKLGVEERVIITFIRERWPEKYQKYLKPSKDHGSGNFLFKDWQIITLLALLVGIAYANSINNEFVSDDVTAILKNDQLQSFDFVLNYGLNFLRPIFVWVIYYLTGATPWLFRLLNIVFHFGSVVFMFYILRKLVSPVTGVLAAILFAVHPLLVESVSWISGGGHAQYAFFLLASFYFYISRDQKVWRYVLSFCLFMLGILTSEKATVFPAILIIYEIVDKSLKKNWYKTIPFWLIDLVFMYIYINRLGVRTTELQTVHYVQAGVDNPLILIPIAISSYLGLAFWPQGLTIYHSEMMFTPTEFFFVVLVFILFWVAVYLSYRKNRLVFFWLTLFFISLLPTLTPLRISWTVAERYVYFGMTGIIAVVAIGFNYLLKNKDFKPVVLFVFCLVVIALMTRTIMRNVDWKNEDNLWIATAKYSPSSPNNHNNLGDVYARHGDLHRAAEEFYTAIQLKPNYADAYHNLGITYQRMGQLDKAILAYEEAVKLSPILWQSYQNLSMIYFDNGNYRKSREYLEKAIQIVPENLQLREILNKMNVEGLGF